MKGRKMKKFFLYICIISHFSYTSFADQADVIVEKGWIRQVNKAGSNSAGYGVIKISDKNEKEDQALCLIKAETDICGHVELHTHQVDKEGVARMRPVKNFNLNKNTPLILKPQGNHLMFMQVKRPLIIGEEIKVTLFFDHNIQKDVVLKVKKSAPCCKNKQ